MTWLAGRGAQLLDAYRDGMRVCNRPPWGRYILADGGTAFDCAQLAVEAGQVVAGPPQLATAGFRLAGAGALASQWRVWAVRDIPVEGEYGSPPADTITASTVGLLADREALVAVTFDLTSPGGPLDGCDDVYVASVAPVAPSGGVGGTVLTLIVSA